MGFFCNKDQSTLIQFPGGKSGSYKVPSSVANIGSYSFSYCYSLTNVAIADSVKAIGSYAFFDCEFLTEVMIGNIVTNIGSNAFAYCFSLTNVKIPASVSDIGDWAFGGCANLAGVFLKGNAPDLGSSAFIGDNNATVYYLPRTTGWGASFGDVPTDLWKPLIQTADGSFGLQTNQFGFNICWSSGQVIVVETCTNLANPIWAALQTNTLSDDLFYFSDSQCTNNRAGFYRLRSP